MVKIGKQESELVIPSIIPFIIPFFQFKDRLCEHLKMDSSPYLIVPMCCPQQGSGENSCAIHVVNNMYRTLFENRDIDILKECHSVLKNDSFRRDLCENWSPIAPDVLL